MRSLALLTFALAALLLGLVLNTALALRTEPGVLPVAPAAGHGELLATVDLSGLTPAAAAQIAGWAAGDGYAHLRVRLPWDAIEPQPGGFRWEVADAAVAAAAAHGLNIVLLLDGAPAWAVAPVDAANPLAPPHDVRDFGRFAAAVAQRYGDRVDVYQVWDEPNIAPHWGARWASPQGYFDLLREARNSLLAADPSARVMLAALAPTTASDGANLPDTSYLEQLYRLGAGPLFDLAAGQAYGFDQAPEAEPSPDRLNFRRPELLYRIMAANGDAGKPLWITAWGWWAGEADATPPWGAVDGDTAAAYLQTGLAFARTRWPWSGPMGWADYIITPGRDSRRSGFALRDPAGGPTLLGRAMAASGVSPILGTGSHALALGDVRMEPDAWRLSPEAADPSHAGAALEVPFEGRSVSVEVQRGPYWATLHAWIDGQPAPLLPRDEAGRSYIALHDPGNEVAVVPLAGDLAPGRHVLRLEASAGWGQWLLRRVIVDHDPRPAPWPFWPVAAVLSLAAVVTAAFWWQALRSADGRAAVARLLAFWDRASSAAASFSSPAVWLAVLLAFSAGLYAAPALWLTLPLLAGVALVFALRLELAPALVLAWLPFYVRPKSFGPVGIPLHELFIWLAFGLWLLHACLRWAAAGQTDGARSHSRRSQGGAVGAVLRSLDAPVLMLLLVAVFASLSASRRGLALYEWRTVFLGPALFYLLVTRNRSGRFDPALAASGLVVGAVAVSLLALAQVAGGRGTAVEGVLRASALYGSANNLALYLGRVLPLLVAGAGLATLQPADTAPAFRRDRRRLLCTLALLPVAAAAFVTFSKGLLLLSLPVGLLVLALLEPRLRRLVLALALLALLALLPFLATPRFSDLLNTESGTTFFRLQLWQSAWRMALDHPWLGVGPDNFLYAYRSGYVLPGAWQELNLSHPHNLFLDLLARLGALGLIAGLWLLAGTLLAGWRVLRSRWAPIRPAYLGLYAGLAAGLAHGLIDNSLFLVDLSILTLFVVAATVRLSDRNDLPA